MLLILRSFSVSEDALSLRLDAVHENSLDSAPRFRGDKLSGNDVQTEALRLLRPRVTGEECAVASNIDSSARQARENPSRVVNRGRAPTRDGFEIEDLIETSIERLEEFRIEAGGLKAQFNERSQEVIENKGDHFITNCNSQEVFENKWVIFCKAKRLVILNGLSTNERTNYGHYA